MRITIDKKFYIEQDELCFTLFESKPGKSRAGTPIITEHAHGYFRDLTCAIKEYVSIKMARRNVVVPLMEYVALYRAEVKGLEKMLEL